MFDNFNKLLKRQHEPLLPENKPTGQETVEQLLARLEEAAGITPEQYQTQDTKDTAKPDSKNGELEEGDQDDEG